MAVGAQVASLYGVLSLRDDLTPALGRAETGVNRFGSRMQQAGGKISAVGDTMTKVGASLLPISAGLSLIGVTGLGAAADFEAAMTEISVRTGLVGDDLQEISDFALQMGADTMFSAQQAAEGFLQLLSSGQNAEEAIATLGVVMDLAAASGEDLGMTADYLTDIMAAFGLGVEDAAMVADHLAAAAGASSADVASLAQGFANVGPIARQFGLDVETTAAALAILSENGIKGAEAGTALKSMLVNMTRDTEDVAKAWDALGTSFYDAAGNARPLPDVLADIKEGLKDKSAEEQNRILTDLAGTYGVVALSALLGDLSIDGMKESMREQASASELAQAQMDTFKGTIDAVKGSIESAMIKAFTPFMENTLKPMAEMLIPIINAVGDWAAKNPELAGTIMAVGLGVVALSMGMLILGPIISAIGAVVGGAGMAFMAFGGVLGIVGILLAAYATNFGGFRDAINDVRTALEEGDIAGILYGIGEALLAIPMGIAGLFVDTEQLNAWVGVWDNLKTIISNLPMLVGMLIEKVTGIEIPANLLSMKGVFNAIETSVAWLRDNASKILGGISFSIPGVIRDLASIVGDIVSGLDKIASFGGVLGTGSQNPAQMQSLIDYGQSLFGPSGHDYTGPYAANQPVMVGTGVQPELFVPTSAGTAYPASMWGSDGGLQTVTIMLPNGDVLYEAVVTEAQRRGEAVVMAS